MKRLSVKKRENWIQKNEDLWFKYSLSNDKPYWNEGFYYEFSQAQINQLQTASNELYQMCLSAVDYVISNDLFEEIGIWNASEIELIKRSWQKKDFSVYGRFDLIYDGIHPPKFIEFNAQTPVWLPETAYAEAQWLEELFPNRTHFNNLETNLIQRWKNYPNDTIFFSSAVFDLWLWITIEELSNATFLAQMAAKAGKNAYFIPNDQLKIDFDQKTLQVKNSDIEIHDIFFHIPSECYSQKEFEFFLQSNINIIEPFWKIILHSKAIAKILWEMYPNHPYLLATYDTPEKLKDYVKKPIISQEWENVEIYFDGKLVQETKGWYGGKWYIYQDFYKPPVFDGWMPNIGAWIVGEEFSWIAIREDNSYIVKGSSLHTPHIIK